MTDFLFSLRPGDKVWDIETFPNAFTATFLDPERDQEWVFEISDRRYDLDLFCRFIEHCQVAAVRWVGFNSLGFDYPVAHFIYQHRYARLTAADIYHKAMEIIQANGPAKFTHVVWERDQLVPQVDLFKIHHFDNKAKSTSLKVLEFNMRAESVEDLPFDVGTVLTPEQIDVLIEYNRTDVRETARFLTHSTEHITMREELATKYSDSSFINSSDVKIGEKILLHALEQSGIELYFMDGTRRVKRQTKRDRIDLAEVIFPYVRFERPEFQEIHRRLAEATLTPQGVNPDRISTKGVFKGLTAAVDGLEYHFGTGGLHASVESQVVASDAENVLVDVDVASYYPNLGIKNRLYPEHLGVGFCDAYEAIYHTRKQHKKGSALNGAFKLALNGSYGNSNNEYSALMDPRYTMSITVNGQLLLAMLVEQLIKVPGLRMIQANTDGVTYLCPRWALDHTRAVCRWWEQLTQLELEEVLYNRMFIRDVNSYIAEKEDGSLKRIGAYAYETALENPGTRELPWHKDWSFRVVAKAAEAALVRGEDIRAFITAHQDVYDFLGRTKVPRSSTLEWGGERVPNIVRYYVSTEGRPLEKVMPAAGPIGQYKRANGVPDHIYRQVLDEIGPGVWDERIHTKNKSVYEERRIGIHTGWRVSICNSFDGVTFDDINHEYYIKEAEKLVTLLK